MSGWLSFEDLEKGGHMNTLFLDIETIPTPEALEDPALSNGDEPEAIKKLSLSACTAR